MSGKYYYLVASLPSLRLDDYKEPYRVRDFAAELAQLLSPADFSCVRDVLLRQDYAVLADVLTDNQNRWQTVTGMWTHEEIEQSIERRTYEFADDALLPLVSGWRKNEEPRFNRRALEEELFRRFYASMLAHKNGFIRDYFSFDLNLRNVLAALVKRKFGLSGRVLLDVAGDPAAAQLMDSSFGDFGLSKELDYLPALIEVFQRGHAAETEKYIDRLRWEKIDELNTFCYFELEVLLGYLIKLILVERWIHLDARRGREKFRERTGVARIKDEWPAA